ncbi:glycoprotein-N-acetylgalactosamine 3-beta-galactosyltransferase 1-B-like [Amblyomma americanum]
MSPQGVRSGALGFAVGVALGLLWRAPAEPSDAGRLPAQAPALLHRHLAATKSNAALFAALKSPLVIAKLEKELEEEAPQSSAVIFCVVYMVHDQYADLDLLVNDTWGRHCDHLLFVSSDPEAVRLGLTTFVDEPDQSRACHRVLRHLHQRGSAVAQWVLWAPVSSFVIVENLRHLAGSIGDSEPVYLGPMWPGSRSPRPGSNTSFALNWAALERIVRSNCSSFRTISRCAYSAGVKVIDSRDEEGCARFFDTHLVAGQLPFRNAFTHLPFPRQHMNELVTEDRGMPRNPRECSQTPG